jgi:hypothetical protein
MIIINPLPIAAPSNPGVNRKDFANRRKRAMADCARAR